MALSRRRRGAEKRAFQAQGQQSWGGHGISNKPLGMQDVVGLSAWGVSAQEGLVSRREGEGRQGLPSFVGAGTGPASQAVENSESMWPLSTGPGGTGILLPSFSPLPHDCRVARGSGGSACPKASLRLKPHSRQPKGCGLNCGPQKVCPSPPPAFVGVTLFGN